MLLRNLKCLHKFASAGVSSRRHFGDTMMKLVDIQPQVRSAVLRGHPVVALESTIITHGMPYPQNMACAHEVQETVLAEGAIPAIIAILDGRIKIGLAEADLVNLTRKGQEEVIKCSRRDIPFVVSRKLSGGTTVAATMMIAHMAGIKVFATGGVGGVHREGYNTMDVSADLVELGRTPVAVVCSGVKSILDIPRTLEYLETQGVCVATYGSESGAFPDFYTRDSGCRVPYNLKSPQEAALLIRTLNDLEMKSGILIGVPIPTAYALDKQLIDAAIAQAYQDAEQKGIKGKEVTPFLLSAVVKLTKGASLEANMALVRNNATVAAQIAKELDGGKCATVTVKGNHPPLIIGASILDLSLTMKEEMPENLNGITIPIHARQSAGGVGRNLAEGILKLYGGAKFISIVGNDQIGKSLFELIPESLQCDVNIDEHHATSLCSVIFDKKGDCKLILGNMEIHQSITPQLVEKHRDAISQAPLIIIDANLSMDTIKAILQLALEYRRPVFFEPTDMSIAAKPFTLPRSLTKQIKYISPNVFELKTIVEVLTKRPVQWQVDNTEPTATVVKRVKEMLTLIEGDFDCILVTLGHHGVLLSVRGGANSFNVQTNRQQDEVSSDLQHSAYFYASPPVKNIVNVSGAGDSFCSGFITGLLRKYPMERCVALGFCAAERALQTESAVPPNYFINESDELSMHDKLQALKTDTS